MQLSQLFCLSTLVTVVCQSHVIS